MPPVPAEQPRAFCYVTVTASPAGQLGPANTGVAGVHPAGTMNPDRLQPGEHCASTSNRNFEGRQGHGGRTHLVSPAMAAAAAIAGHFVDVRTFA